MSEQGVFPSILKQPSTDDLSRPFWEASVEERLAASLYELRHVPTPRAADLLRVPAP